MPEFVMEGRDEPDFQALDEFTQAYIEAMFWTSTEPRTTREQRVTPRGNVRKEWAHRASEGYQQDMPGDYGFADLAPEALAEIVADCKRFQEENAVLLEEAYGLSADRMAYTPERAGHDFWLTRNGHGCGFWSRSFEGETDIGDRLSARCGWRSRGETRFGEVNAYVGDNQKVYLGG